MLKTDWPALLRHVETALAAAFLVKELAAGAEGMAVGVAMVGDPGCAVIFEMVSVAKEL